MAEISKEYAMALFGLSLEEGCTEAVAEGVALLRQTALADPEYTAFLSCPAIPMPQRLEAIREAYAASLQETLLSFLLLVCEKGHLAHLEETLAEFSLLYDAYQRRGRGHVRSAVALTEEQKTRLCDRISQMQGGPVTLSYSIDPNLLGGMVVEMDGKVYDGSLRHRLQELKGVMNQ